MIRHVRLFVVAFITFIVSIQYVVKILSYHNKLIIPMFRPYDFMLLIAVNKSAKIKYNAHWGKQCKMSKYLKGCTLA